MPRSLPASMLLAFALAVSVASPDRSVAGGEPVPPVGTAFGVASVVPCAVQPAEKDPRTIWFDDFRADRTYSEQEGPRDAAVGSGGSHGSMRCSWKQGDMEGVGNRKVFFGDCADRRKIVRGTETFDDVYWRCYVLYEEGWDAGGEWKLTRATSLVTSDWAQAWTAYVWPDGGSASLSLDPVTMVWDGKVRATHYNDTGKGIGRWLGQAAAVRTPTSSKAESGRWICVESRVRLNTPGKSDGLNQLWIDGRLEVDKTGLDWRGTYTGHGVNAVFFEAYWNSKAPRALNRWFDDIVISTAPIGPIVAPRNPELILTRLASVTGCDLEVASDVDGAAARVLWRATTPAGEARIRVDGKRGTFVGSGPGATLPPDEVHWVRARATGTSGAGGWSRWHAAFRTAKDGCGAAVPPR